MSDSVFSLEGTVNVDSVIELRRDLEVLVYSKSGAELSLDLAGLETVSSVVLSTMLCLLRYAQSVSCKLSFANISPKLFDVIRVGGLESIIPRTES